MAADSLLLQLANIPIKQPHEPNQVSCDNSPGSVEGHIALLLRRDLGFSCAERAIRAVLADSATSVYAQRQVVFWDNRRAHSNVVWIAFSYARRNPQHSAGDSAALAPLVAGLEAIPALLRTVADMDRSLVVSVARAYEWGIGPPFPLPASQSGGDESYTTLVDSYDETLPYIPPLLGRPGWVIGTGRPLSPTASSTPRNQLDEGQGDLGTPARGSHPPISVDYSAQFTVHAHYWPQTDQEFSNITGMRNTLVRQLQSVVDSPPRISRLPIHWQSVYYATYENKWFYWLCAVFIPVCILGLSVLVVMAESTTMVEVTDRSVRRAVHSRKQLKRKLTHLGRAEAALVSRKNRPKGPAPNHAEREEAVSGDKSDKKGGLVSRWTSRARQVLTGKVSTMKKGLQWQLEQADNDINRPLRLRNSCEVYREGARKRLGNLGRDIWSNLSQSVGDRKGIYAFLSGVVFISLAFWLAYEVERDVLQLQRLLPVESGLWETLFVVSMTLFLGSIYARGAPWAFAGGITLICFVGLDSVELSPLHDGVTNGSIGDLFDSQVVGPMFGCVALLLSLHAAIESPRRFRVGYGFETGELDEDLERLVQKSIRSGRRRERRYIYTLVLLFGLLTYNTIGGSLWRIISGEQPMGLGTVTAVVLVALLLPAVVLLSVAWRQDTTAEKRTPWFTLLKSEEEAANMKENVTHGEAGRKKMNTMTPTVVLAAVAGSSLIWGIETGGNSLGRVLGVSVSAGWDAAPEIHHVTWMVEKEGIREWKTSTSLDSIGGGDRTAGYPAIPQLDGVVPVPGEGMSNDAANACSRRVRIVADEDLLEVGVLGRAGLSIGVLGHADAPTQLPTQLWLPRRKGDLWWFVNDRGQLDLELRGVDLEVEMVRRYGGAVAEEWRQLVPSGFAVPDQFVVDVRYARVDVRALTRYGGRGSEGAGVLSGADLKALEDTVYFGFASDDIALDHQCKLAEAATVLRNSTGVGISILGHADDFGTEDYNCGLGTRRAKSVVEFFSQRGIDPSRFAVVSYGESLPLGGERRHNRRVEITVSHDPTVSPCSVGVEQPPPAGLPLPRAPSIGEFGWRL